MALRAKSLFLYGFEVTALNRSLDFKTSIGGIEKLATLRLGFYSLDTLLVEIVRAMTEADPANTFTATANRTYNSNTENRVTIATTTAPALQLLFSSGSRAASSVAPLIGFSAIDFTGLLSYAGTSTAGTSLIPEYVGYNYLGPEFMRKVFGSVNISADGSKESIVYSVQRFLQVEFKYEPQAKVISEWADMFDWMIRQKPFEFTPEITTPTLYYNCTLETTVGDSKGLGYTMKEMLPQFPFNYQTGNLKMRQIVPPGGFI